MGRTRKVDAHTERLIAVKACVDPRTVGRFLAGKTMRSTTAAVVRTALVDLGMAHLLIHAEQGGGDG